MDTNASYQPSIREMWGYWEPLASDLAEYLEIEMCIWKNPGLEAFYAMPLARCIASLETEFRPIPPFLDAFQYELRERILVNLDLDHVHRIDSLAARVNQLMADDQPIDGIRKSLELRRCVIQAERLLCGSGPYQRMPEFAAAYSN